jgi:hypothetical protein
MLEHALQVFANMIMAKLQASKPVAFQFVLWIRLKIEKRQPQSGWSRWFESCRAGHACLPLSIGLQSYEGTLKHVLQD